MKTFKTIAAAIIVTLGTSAAAEGIEVNASGQPFVEVFYDDLNLESEAGRAKLEGRVLSASKQVCGYNTGRKPIAEEQSIRSCVKFAQSKARASLARNGRMIVVAKLDTSNQSR